MDFIDKQMHFNMRKALRQCKKVWESVRCQRAINIKVCFCIEAPNGTIVDPKENPGVLMDFYESYIALSAQHI